MQGFELVVVIFMVLGAVALLAGILHKPKNQ
jgi:hypothetical protein